MIKKEPLPSLLNDANKKKVPIRNNLDMAIFYFRQKNDIKTP